MTSPKAAIREALLQPVPCLTNTCGSVCHSPDHLSERIDTQAGNVELLLIERGFLPDPAQPEQPTAADLEEVARFLARESRFIRYYDSADPNDDGWRRLLSSESDVQVAFSKARGVHEVADKETTAALSRARDLLLDHIAQRRAAGDGA